MLSQWPGLEGKTAFTYVTWSPDEKMLAIGSDDKTIRLWDIATKQVHANVKADSSLMVKGIIVRDVLSKALEQSQGQGSRNDTSQDWRLYNILWYRISSITLKTR